MRRSYDDKFIHYSVLILLLIGIFFEFSGFSLPRLVYYSVYYPDKASHFFYAIKPFFNLSAVLLVGGFLYLLFSKGYFVDGFKVPPLKRKIRWKTSTVVHRLTWLTLLLMLVVVLEKFVFHMKFNRWLIAPKHTVLITGLVITSYFLFISYQLAKESINWKKVWIISGAFILLLIGEPDTGTTLLLFASLLTLLFFRLQNKFYHHFFRGILFALLILTVFSIINSKLKLQIPNFLDNTPFSHVVVRINNWLDPFHDVTDRSYQIANSLYAVHKGGFWGEGFGFGVRKLYMGATVHTDFIFATVGEEGGFILCVFVFAVTLLLLFRLLNISYRFKSRFEKYFTLLVALETFAMAFVNAGMAVNLLPSKGWPYPLISYGPFFTVFYIIQLGIVQHMINTKFYEIYGKGK